MFRIGSPPPTPPGENPRQSPRAPTPQPRKHEGKFGKFAWVKKIENKLETLTVKVSPKNSPTKKKEPAPTITTTTATITATQQDLAASEPAMRTGEKARPSNEIMAECLKMLLERLIEADRDEVGTCFDLLKRLARNHEFAAAALDAWIAEALKNCESQDLDRIDENARRLLPKDEPLANGIELAIATTLLAFQLAEAVQNGEIPMVARTLGAVLDAVPREKLVDLIEPMPPSEARKTLGDLRELLEERERLEAAKILVDLAMCDMKS
jgi:hypothetical protein